MSRFLLVNFEEFGLNQDITKTIQSYSPFCICCLTTVGPMIGLEKCNHSEYLDNFGKAELKQFNQLVCLLCHSFLRKIKSFQHQVLESFQILLSGTYTNNTISNKRMNKLVKQDTAEIVNLPPEDDDESNAIEPIKINSSIINADGVNMQINSNLNNEPNNLDSELINKNIKTALDILERNNQSFISLSSQLQFLNGEHLSFLESSLLSKEILSDIPLVPSKNSGIDLRNELVDSRSEMEMDGQEKIFYDCLNLSPELGDNMSDSIIDSEIEPITQQHKPKTKVAAKPKIKRKLLSTKVPQPIKVVRLSQDELNKERVRKAQSESYLKYKFRCGTCLLGFNYKENLEDHSARKHGPKCSDYVICDICSQVISSSGAMTEHNYRHYTRYDCIQCGKRYQTYDEATRHLNRTHATHTDKSRKTRLKKYQAV